MKSKGIRRSTRKKFKKDLRKHGRPTIKAYQEVFKNKDYVDIVINSACHIMVHKRYHGRTGQVYKVDKRTIGVKVKMIEGNSQHIDYIDVRPEHLKKSKCRTEFLERSKEYFKNKNEGKVVSPKRVMEGERKEFTVSLKNNEPLILKNERYFKVF